MVGQHLGQEKGNAGSLPFQPGKGLLPRDAIRRRACPFPWVPGALKATRKPAGGDRPRNRELRGTCHRFSCTKEHLLLQSLRCIRASRGHGFYKSL